MHYTVTGGIGSLEQHFDNGRYLNIIYPELQKGFDTVLHIKITRKKMKKSNKAVYNWYKNY